MGNNSELIKQLKRSDEDDDNDDVGSNRNDDENYNDLDETMMGNFDMRNENEDTIRSMQREKYMLTFKGVEDPSISSAAIKIKMLING